MDGWLFWNGAPASVLVGMKSNSQSPSEAGHREVSGRAEQTMLS